MRIQRNPHLLQQELIEEKRSGKIIGFVPTMGALHQGHTSLMDVARPKCDILVCSIYVNPLQFAPNEDLDKYPNTPESDHQLCAAHGVDIVFRPTELYAQGHSTFVSVQQLTSGLCGASRPTHFDGVTTVVARLFGLVQPDIAVFGQKDYQQLAVIRRMAQDLALPVEVIGAPIVRDHDGLALSSRNVYLSPQNRQRALSLSKTLQWIQCTAQDTIEPLNVPHLCTKAQAFLDIDRLDYLEIVDPDSLEPLEILNQPARALVAAVVGGTRLIDNLSIQPNRKGMKS